MPGAMTLSHSAMLMMVQMPSRETVNHTILAVGILLQLALVFAVFQRGLARRFPAFTALLIFYPLRACLLFALAGRIDADDYNPLYNALSLAEVPLQAAVMLELLLRLMRELGGWTQRRAAVVIVSVAAACVLTWLVRAHVQTKDLADRMQVFGWFAMLALFAAAMKGARSWNLRCIAGGFGVFSLAQLAALLARNHAMLGHQGGAYVAWSYVPAGGYLVVVAFWIVALRRGESASLQVSEPAA